MTGLPCWRCGDLATDWPLFGLTVCATCLDAPASSRPLVGAGAHAVSKVALAAVVVAAIGGCCGGPMMAFSVMDSIRRGGSEHQQVLAGVGAILVVAVVLGYVYLKLRDAWTRQLLDAHGLPWLEPRDVLEVPFTIDGPSREDGLVLFVPGGVAFLGVTGRRARMRYADVATWSPAGDEVWIEERSGRTCQLAHRVRGDLERDLVAAHLLRRVGKPGERR